jgi:hypothetical protein
MIRPQPQYAVVPYGDRDITSHDRLNMVSFIDIDAYQPSGSEPPFLIFLK